jgi:hypothetical protein
MNLHPLAVLVAILALLTAACTPPTRSGPRQVPAATPECPSPAAAHPIPWSAVNRALQDTRSSRLCGEFVRVDRDAYGIYSRLTFLDRARVRFLVSNAVPEPPIPAQFAEKPYLIQGDRLFVFDDVTMLQIQVTDRRKLRGLVSPVDEACWDRKKPPAHACALKRQGCKERLQLRNRLCFASGRILDRRGDLPGARARYAACCRSGDPESCSRLGRIAEALGQPSLRAYQRACRLGSGTGCYYLWFATQDRATLIRACQLGNHSACADLHDPPRSAGDRPNRPDVATPTPAPTPAAGKPSSLPAALRR